MKRLLVALLLAASALGVDETSIQNTLRALGDPAIERREAASRQLLDWGREAPEKVLPLLTACSADPDLEVRERVEALRIRIARESRRRSALRLSEDPGWRQAVEALFEDPTEATLFALTQTGDHTAAAEVISGFLGQESVEIRGWAALILGTLKEGAVAPLLAPLLADSNKDIREFAAVALLNLKNVKEPDALLLPCLRHTEPETRKLAAQCLGSLGSRVSFPILLPLLEDEMEAVRFKAAESLCTLSRTLNDRSLLPALLKLLEAKPAETRIVAAHTLGLLKDPSALPALAALLEDANPCVPPFAAESMGLVAGQAWACDAKGVEDARAWWTGHKAPSTQHHPTDPRD